MGHLKTAPSASPDPPRGTLNYMDTLILIYFSIKHRYFYMATKLWKILHFRLVIKLYQEYC